MKKVENINTKNKLKILLTTEGTYPFHQGGVSTWCDILVNNLKEVDYYIYSITMNPFVTQKFTLPENTGLIQLPLWGTEEPGEHLPIPFSSIYLAKKRTTSKVISDNFLPIFEKFIIEAASIDKNTDNFTKSLVDMYNFFGEYEYKQAFKSEHTWNTYKDTILSLSKIRHQGFDAPSVYALIQSIGWIYRFMNIINTPLPKVDVVHSAAAAFCGIPGVILKSVNNTPYMLTEHGVYLREQYISLAGRKYPSFLTTFLIRFVQSVVLLNYKHADQISPVCEYNTRWEKEFGVTDKQIKVIYNGIDPKIFDQKSILNETSKKENKRDKSYTIVTVARIDPLKDMKTLLKTAEIVIKAMPNVEFKVYGSVSVEQYYKECLELKDSLILNGKFEFVGHTNNTAAAYKSGDINVLTSISEAFPYSVVEAMMTGIPVVATDVGGIREAIGDTGFVVTPGDEKAVAAAIIKLLNDDALRLELGEMARERALNYFTINKVLDQHLKSYQNLSLNLSKLNQKCNVISLIKLNLDKGLALLSFGCYKEAITSFELILKENPDNIFVPAILTYIAEANEKLGKTSAAKLAMTKAYLLSIQSSKTSA
jgi:glycosyltransferase involved in cell wall biosynthesis